MAALQNRQQVVVLGGGFGGLHAVHSLRDVPVDVTLIDRRNFHLFQPLLYQVATGTLSPANIAAPLRSILRHQRNVRVLLGEAVDLDVAGRRVILSDDIVAYDTLIVATGSRHSYFGHADWEAAAPGLKTLEDATEIRRRILLAFEAAERGSASADDVHAWLTFVIVGGGPTGVELAGALAEIARHTLKRDFRTINPADARILLLEGADRILLAYPPVLAERARQDLLNLGVEVKTGTIVTAVDAEGVMAGPTGRSERIAAKTVLWAAGVEASPLGRLLAKAGAAGDRIGRVIVEPDLTVAGHPEIFVIGDLAHCKDAADKPLPGIAPVAMQEGRYAARLIAARLRHAPLAPFAYHDRGSMATIGRAAAIADFGRLRFGGFFAWMAWLFVHLMYIVQFQNRLLVLLQWAWSYLTWNRGARLITGPNPLPLKGRPVQDGTPGTPSA